MNKTMKTSDRKLGALIGGAAAALTLGLAAPAGAQAELLLEIPIDGVTYGEEGDRILVASANVPSNFVGETCLVTGDADNQESVHPGNNLEIVAGDQVLVVPDVESEADLATHFGEFGEITPTIEVYIVLGVDGVSSGGFSVSVDCSVMPPEESTTTTEAPPTTEAPTTTEAPPEGPEVTSPAEPTTTTAPPATVAPTTAPPPAGPEATLPITGSSAGILAAVGSGLLGLGLVARQRSAAALKGNQSR